MCLCIWVCMYVCMEDELRDIPSLCGGYISIIMYCTVQYKTCADKCLIGMSILNFEF